MGADGIGWMLVGGIGCWWDGLGGGRMGWELVVGIVGCWKGLGAGGMGWGLVGADRRDWGLLAEFEGL